MQTWVVDSGWLLLEISSSSCSHWIRQLDKGVLSTCSMPSLGRPTIMQSLNNQDPDNETLITEWELCEWRHSRRGWVTPARHAFRHWVYALGSTTAWFYESYPKVKSFHFSFYIKFRFYKLQDLQLALIFFDVDLDFEKDFFLKNVIGKMAMLPKATYRSNAIPSKIPKAFFNRAKKKSDL